MIDVGLLEDGGDGEVAVHRGAVGRIIGGGIAGVAHNPAHEAVVTHSMRHKGNLGVGLHLIALTAHDVGDLVAGDVATGTLDVDGHGVVHGVGREVGHQIDRVVDGKREGVVGGDDVLVAEIRPAIEGVEVVVEIDANLMLITLTDITLAIQRGHYTIIVFIKAHAMERQVVGHEVDVAGQRVDDILGAGGLLVGRVVDGPVGELVAVNVAGGYRHLRASVIAAVVGSCVSSDGGGSALGGGGSDSIGTHEVGRNRHVVVDRADSILGVGIVGVAVPVEEAVVAVSRSVEGDAALMVDHRILRIHSTSTVGADDSSHGMGQVVEAGIERHILGHLIDYVRLVGGDQVGLLARTVIPSVEDPAGIDLADTERVAAAGLNALWCTRVNRTTVAADLLGSHSEVNIRSDEISSIGTILAAVGQCKLVHEVVRHIVAAQVPACEDSVGVDECSRKGYLLSLIDIEGGVALISATGDLYSAEVRVIRSHADGALLGDIIKVYRKFKVTLDTITIISICITITARHFLIIEVPMASIVWVGIGRRKSKCCTLTLLTRAFYRNILFAARCAVNNSHVIPYLSDIEISTYICVFCDCKRIRVLCMITRCISPSIKLITIIWLCRQCNGLTGRKRSFGPVNSTTCRICGINRGRYCVLSLGCC